VVKIISAQNYTGVDTVEGSKSFRHMSPYPRATPSGSVPIPPADTPSQISRSNRSARFEAVRTLHQQLVSQREIARRLSLSRNTVRKFLQAEAFPERSQPPYRGSILDPYKPYILARWKSGCWNGAQLLEEVKKLGYTGSAALLRSFLTQVRKQHRAAGNALALDLISTQGSMSAPDDLPVLATWPIRSLNKAIENIFPYFTLLADYSKGE
jgi:predicted DNA-binding protein (UPF0251 family)